MVRICLPQAHVWNTWSPNSVTFSGGSGNCGGPSYNKQVPEVHGVKQFWTELSVANS